MANLASTFAPSQALKTLPRVLHGTAIGAASGFMLGGPLGGLIGTALGAAYDRTRKVLFEVTSIHDELSNLDAPKFTPQPDSRALETAFTIGIIALGAKLARLGKTLDRHTVEQFRQAFKLPPSDTPMIRRMFEQALFDHVGHKPYADQLAGLFAQKPEMLEALLQGLARFAKLDAQTVPLNVLEYLGNLAKRFGIAPGRLDELLQMEGVGYAAAPIKQTAFEILGVKVSAPEIVVKQAYRSLIMDCHPDRLRATNDDPQALADANDRMATLNAAYAEIRKARGWK